MKTITIITSTRAEYGLLRPVIQKVAAAQDLQLQLVVTGAHLCARFGNTVQEIEADGLPIAARLSIFEENNPNEPVALTIARTITVFDGYFSAHRPDAVLLLGDRFEIFAVAAAAAARHIPIAHISGGDVTLGAADERDLPAEGAAAPINAARYAKLLTDCLQAQNEPLLRTLLDELKADLTANDRSVSAAKLLLGEIYVTVRQQIGYLYKNDMTAFSSESASVRQIDEAPSLHAALDFLAQQFLAFSAQVHTNSADDVVTRVQRYIDRNCTQPLKLEELAPLFGYNASYLGKLFREKAQCSFNEYLDRARIEQAKAMLANGNKRVYEIAQELGYKDVDYFHKKFKKYVGVSPNEYRRTPAEPPKW